MTPKILVYGYGNPGRQDDGCGIVFTLDFDRWHVGIYHCRHRKIKLTLSQLPSSAINLSAREPDNINVKFVTALSWMGHQVMRPHRGLGRIMIIIKLKRNLWGINQFFPVVILRNRFSAVNMYHLSLASNFHIRNGMYWNGVAEIFF